MSGQSAFGGVVKNRCAVLVTRNTHKVAIAYLKTPNQRGGISLTPILITGQLTAHVRMSNASKAQLRRSIRPPSTDLCSPRPCRELASIAWHPCSSTHDRGTQRFRLRGRPSMGRLLRGQAAALRLRGVTHANAGSLMKASFGVCAMWLV